jgi:hypothetical protein
MNSKKINNSKLNGKIAPNEIKLLRADYRTGRVLDENYTLYDKTNVTTQIMYTYFDDLESAIDYINTNKSSHINVEFHIFINDKSVYTDISDLDLTTELYLTPNFRQSYYRVSMGKED